MKLTNEILESLAKAKANTFNIFHKDEDVKEYFKQEIANSYLELNDEKVKCSRKEYFQIDGAAEDSYGEFVFELASNLEVIAGIRHLGGNSKLPFVKLDASCEIKSKSEALKIYDAIRDRFNIFNPKWIKFGSKELLDVDFLGSVHMVASEKDYLALPILEAERRLELKVETDASYYQWYCQGYEEFHQDFPQLRDKVPVNSLESMEESLQAGLLQTVYLNGEKIGLIAGEREDFLGHPGLYFHEIFLHKNWRGKGLAKSIQKRFVLENVRKNDFIWGTIDMNNKPSLKTALANGRRPVHYECFVAIL